MVQQTPEQQFEQWLRGVNLQSQDWYKSIGQLLIYLNRTAVRVETILRQLTGEVPIIIQPTITPITLALPLDPDTLLHAIQAEKVIGQAMFPTFSITFLAAAGATTSLTLPLAPGWYGVHRSPLEITSDFYDMNINANVYVDGILVNPMPLSFTGPLLVGWGEYYVKHIGIRLEIINGTVTNALITKRCQGTFLEKGFYEEWFKPLVDFIFQSLTKFAEAQREI